MYGDYGTGERYLIDIHPENFKIPDGFSFCRENDSLIVYCESESYKNIAVTKDGIEVISNNGNVFYERENIRQIFYKWNSMMCESCLYLVLNNRPDAQPLVLLSGICSVLFPRYIEQEAEKILGIDDDIVRGEFDAKLKKSGYDKIKTKDVSYKINPDSAVFKTHTPIFMLLAMHLLVVISIVMAFLFIYNMGGCMGWAIAMFLFMLSTGLLGEKSKIFSIHGSQFELIEEIMFIKDTFKSGNISDIDYVYMFDNSFDYGKSFGYGEHGYEYSYYLVIKFKDSSDDLILVRTTDKNTVEFLQKIINETFHFNGNFKRKVNLNKYKGKVNLNKYKGKVNLNKY